MKVIALLAAMLFVGACATEVSTSSWGPCPQDPRGGGAGSFDTAGVTVTVDGVAATSGVSGKWNWVHWPGESTSWVDIEISAGNAGLTLRCYTDAWLAAPVANAAKVCTLGQPPAPGTIQGSLSSAARSGKMTLKDAPAPDDTGAVDLMLDVTATVEENGHAVRVELHGVVLHVGVKWFAPGPCA